MQYKCATHFCIKVAIKKYQLSIRKHEYPINAWTFKTWKNNIVNWTCQSLNGYYLEITSTVPLKGLPINFSLPALYRVTWPINNSTSSELYLCKNDEYIVVSLSCKKINFVNTFFLSAAWIRKSLLKPQLKNYPLSDRKTRIFLLFVLRQMMKG